MSRRLLVAALAVTVLAAGWYGSWSYAHDYYVYRGFPKATDPPGVQHGRLVTLKVWSRALHARRSVLVYLPPGYAHGARLGHRYPVLYLLQSSFGQATNYFYAGALNTRIDTLTQAHRIPPFITVMPGGHGSDHEWANAQAGNFEGYVLDVVHAIDQRFSTIQNRNGRAIGGLSEGGYGAANIALRHLGTFSAFESWSGYFTQQRVFPFANASPAKIAANSPAIYVRRRRSQLRRLPARAFLYQATHDDVSIPAMMAFARGLKAAGADVQTAVYGGGHNWALWRAHFTHMLIWAGQGFPR